MLLKCIPLFCTFVHYMQNLCDMYTQREMRHVCVYVYSLWFVFVRDLVHLQMRLCWHDVAAFACPLTEL
jgi:hypothetical protein